MKLSSGRTKREIEGGCEQRELPERFRANIGPLGTIISIVGQMAVIGW